MISGIIKWLKDRQDNIVVPKTLAKCVFTEGGNNLQNLSSKALYKGTGGAITQLPSINPVMIMSDLNYSTEEQLTGKRWIDGKPIYQITFLGNEITIPNIDTCFVLFSMAYSPTYNNYDVIPMSEYLCRWSYSKANSKLTLFDNTGFHSEYFTTIQYTKTTDTASSPVAPPKVEAMHVYSTEEKVVGTWVDGRPVYEIVVFGSGYNDSNSWNDTGVTIENIDNLVENSISCKFSGDQIAGVGLAWLKISLSGRLYTYQNSYSAGRNYDFIVSLSYTKTTD